MVGFCYMEFFLKKLGGKSPRNYCEIKVSSFEFSRKINLSPAKKKVAIWKIGL